MKDNLEQNFKESLENFELPYDPKAWAAMRNRLDVVRPVSKLPIYLGIGAGVAAVATLVLLTVHFSNKDKQVDEVSQLNPTSTTVNVDDAESNNSESSDKKNNAYSNTNNSINPTSQPNSDLLPNNTSNPSNPFTITPSSPINPRQTTTSDDNNIVMPVPEKTFRFVHPDLAELLCSGTVLSLTNKNDLPLKITAPNGKETTIKANDKGKVQLSHSGRYSYGYTSDNEFFVQGNFDVQDSPDADFTISSSDVKYDESGLPVTYVSSNQLATNYSWNFEGAKADTRDAAAHFFKKGKHRIELTVTAANGCKNTVEKQVMIEENYNLMAMNSFVPTDVDPANATFMPYSLKLRNTGFRMIILDPRDGHLIFETSDASQGWDGIDRQTGQLVQYETAYIWKVVLDKPLKNESPEYAGTVIPISRRR